MVRAGMTESEIAKDNLKKHGSFSYIKVLLQTISKYHRVRLFDIIESVHSLDHKARNNEIHQVLKISFSIPFLSLSFPNPQPSPSNYVQSPHSLGFLNNQLDYIECRPVDFSWNL